jgi:prolyl oligopeptidase
MASWPSPKQRYPATMVITGDHDTRVMSAHSFKFAAALQAAQAGHASGATTSQLIEERADAYAFLFRNLGMN